MKKYYILALTFLCLLMGQCGFAQLSSGDAEELEEVCVGLGCEHVGEDGWWQYHTSQTFEQLADVTVTRTPHYNSTTDMTYSYLLNYRNMSNLDQYAYSEFTIGPDAPLTRIWYYDHDRDGYYGDISPSESSPGNYWELWTYGYDCDDNNITIINDCIIEPESLIENAFTITDSNNPNRTVSNQQTLVMVDSGEEREASMNMTTSFGGDITWSGTGVTGNGSSATYSGTTSTSVGLSVSGSLAATGNIQIVNENKISYSSEIQSIGTKINAVSDTFRSFVEAKGSTVTAGSKSCSLTGTIESKNVDMYADGTKYGNATSIDINGTYSMTMPKVKIPIYTAPAVNVFATLDLGSATASLNVNGSLDDSTAAKVDLAGGFELGFTAASGAISATLGNADHFCAEATGTVSVGYFKVGGKVEGNSNATGLLLTPVVKVGNIKADFSVTALINIGTIEERCELYKDDYEIWPAQDFPYSPIILYQKQ